MDVTQVKSEKKSDGRPLPWVEKHRPKTLSDIAGQHEIVSMLKKTLEKDGNIPHLLFYGSAGTGKTSTALALARELYGKKFSQRVLEKNASDERGIKVVREEIKTFAGSVVSKDSNPPFKLIILDEADSMTKDAQAALRRIIEKYTGITRFCLICNYVNKIIEPIASRCAKFRFKALDPVSSMGRLNMICDSEGIDISDVAKKEVLRISRGDLRSSITLLQCASQFCEGGKVTPEAIVQISGTLPREIIDDIWEVIDDYDELLKLSLKIMSDGYSAQMVISQFAQDLIQNERTIVSAYLKGPLRTDTHSEAANKKASMLLNAVKTSTSPVDLKDWLMEFIVRKDGHSGDVYFYKPANVEPVTDKEMKFRSKNEILTYLKLGEAKVSKSKESVAAGRVSNDVRMKIFVILANAEKALVEGADEYLQLLSAVSQIHLLVVGK